MKLIGGIPADRPQDNAKADGGDFKYEPLEHGGAEPDNMPQAIRVTDPEGRTRIYVPMTR